MTEGLIVRLWSIHPGYLDSKGLVAAWREALLAKKVLQGKTKGYTHHPQLLRFRECPAPVDEINAYLDTLYTESVLRGYRFNKRKITYRKKAVIVTLPVTDGQIAYEFRLLQTKLKKRDIWKYKENGKTAEIKVNGLFTVIHGGTADWEKIKPL
jgi:hypothetical protein